MCTGPVFENWENEALDDGACQTKRREKWREGAHDVTQHTQTGRKPRTTAIIYFPLPV